MHERKAADPLLTGLLLLMRFFSVRREIIQQRLRESLEKEGIKMAEAELTMIPQNYVDIDDPEVVKKFTRIIDMLEEDDDVQAVYHNANLPEEDDED